MMQLELFCAGGDSIDEDEAVRIEDDDGGTESDGDVCDTCDCLRASHEDGKGACHGCGKCKRYKEPG